MKNILKISTNFINIELVKWLKNIKKLFYRLF